MLLQAIAKLSLDVAEIQAATRTNYPTLKPVCRW